jgi:inorganic pyrophosphatase
MKNPDFWRKLDELIASCKIVIDRPKGTRHPRYPQVAYEVDYGYLEGTSSMDGDGIDLYLGSLPEKTLSGIIVIVDAVKKDSEIKLLLGVNQQELSWIMDWCNGTELMKGLLIEREG